MRNLLETRSLTRRTVLKGLSATVAAAAMAGCSSGDDDDTVVRTDNYVMEKGDRYAFNTGPFNCGGKCVHKYHIKNGRIFAMTSAGDTPQCNLNENDAQNEDEWAGIEENTPMQFRSCVRGFSYIQRVYQPDRLKYPMMQTVKRGDTTGFVRISWDKAYEEIAKKYLALFQYWKSSGLPYIPAFDGYGIVEAYSKAEGTTYLKRCSNASNGNSEAAKLDATGGEAYRNSKTDNLNAGFIIYWGCDPTRHSNHESGSYWPALKAKEAGIPIVTISPVCTDQAAIYSKSIPDVAVPRFTAAGTDKKVTIPGWIPIRPGTDGALLEAMMYVIYRRELYDKKFLDTEHKNFFSPTPAVRKCFGFWKGDSTVSVAPKGAMGGFPPYNRRGMAVGADFNNQPMTTPAGFSFEERLATRETEWGLMSGAGFGETNEVLSYQTLSDQDKQDAYTNVLAYAAKLTGVSTNVIEALALFYADNGSGKPSKIDNGQGTQRQHGGAEMVWLMICLTAICGFTDKKGGGAGIGMGSLPDNAVFRTKEDKKATGTSVNNRVSSDAKNNYIDIQGQAAAELILNGGDGRSTADFLADNAYTDKNGNTIPNVEVKLFAASSGNGLITQANVNKNILAYKSLDIGVIWADDVLAPTVAHADILLPRSTFLENAFDGLGGQSDIKILQQTVLYETMYDSRRTTEITDNVKHHVVKKLYENGFTALDPAKYPAHTRPTLEKLQSTETAKEKTLELASSDMYDAATGTPWEANDDTWEEMKTKGRVQIHAPADKPIIGMQHFRLPGGTLPDGTPLPAGDFRKALNNSTGYINFFSPFWYERKHSQTTIVAPWITRGQYYGPDAGWRTLTAAYVPVREGYEQFFNNGAGFSLTAPFTGFKAPSGSNGSGRTYGLQFLTNKARNRAHTCQDNVAIIKDQFVQKVYINPIDATKRGIKDGDMVYAYNERGCTYLPAEVTHYIAPGVISIEHGSWYRPQTAGLHGGPVEVSLRKPE